MQIETFDTAGISKRIGVKDVGLLETLRVFATDPIGFIGQGFSGGPANIGRNFNEGASVVATGAVNAATTIGGVALNAAQRLPTLLTLGLVAVVLFLGMRLLKMFKG